MKTAGMKLKRMVFGRSDERGLTMIETLVAVALLATLGVAFLSALTTSTNATTLVEKKVDVDQLARTQLEYIKGLEYIPVHDEEGNLYYGTAEDLKYKTIDDPTLPDPVELPANYSILIGGPVNIDEDDEDIQEITVTIQKDGADLLVVEGYKVNR